MPPRTAANMTDHRALIILLRVVGVVACTAIIAGVMPTTWIAATLQLGGEQLSGVLV